MDTPVLDVRATVRDALDGARPLTGERLKGCSPADLTEALGELEPIELRRLFATLGDETLAELLAEIDAFDAARLIGKLTRAEAADVLEEMDPDDAADVVRGAAAARCRSDPQRDGG